MLIDYLLSQGNHSLSYFNCWQLQWFYWII